MDPPWLFCSLNGESRLYPRTSRHRKSYSLGGAGQRWTPSLREGNADYTDILGANMPYSYKNPGGTLSGALGRRDFMRPEFIAMLNEAGGPRWRYESRAGLLTFVLQ